MEDKILWIVLGVVTIAITLMLTLWKREEPTVERKPEVGDKLIIVQIGVGKGQTTSASSSTNVKTVKRSDDKGFSTTDGYEYPALAHYVYQLQSDNKLYKW